MKHAPRPHIKHLDMETVASREQNTHFTAPTYVFGSLWFPETLYTHLDANQRGLIAPYSIHFLADKPQ